VSGAGAVVGVDIGGTFTDVALLDPDGRLTVGKQATTPEDPASASSRRCDTCSTTPGSRPTP